MHTRSVDYRQLSGISLYSYVRLDSINTKVLIIILSMQICMLISAYCILLDVLNPDGIDKKHPEFIKTICCSAFYVLLSHFKLPFNSDENKIVQENNKKMDWTRPHKFPNWDVKLCLEI